MIKTSTLDITRADQRGLTMGLNEFSSCVGVALAGWVTAYVVATLGAQLGLLQFGLTVIELALVLTVVWVNTPRSWAKAETTAHKITAPKNLPCDPQGVSDTRSTREVFALMSWRKKRLASMSQAGRVEKFVDAPVWVIFPVLLVGKGATLTEMGWIVGTYGFVWGRSQLFTGRLSDHVGRFWPICWACGSVVLAY